MQNLMMDGTDRNPKIEFDYQKGELKISGRSIHENPLDFYREVLDWVSEYVQNPPAATHLIFDLIYYNTSSSKCLLDMLRILEELARRGHPIDCKWYTEFPEDDEDLVSLVDDFAVEIIQK
jgi:hypothetical protein